MQVQALLLERPAVLAAARLDRSRGRGDWLIGQRADAAREGGKAMRAAAFASLLDRTWARSTPEHPITALTGQ
jgi:hypothetical protein